MKKLNRLNRVPMPQLILWWAIRASLLGFSIYGILHGSTTQFLMGLFAIAFSHMWDMWQLFGGRSFITKVGYFPQTLLNIFIFFGVIIGYVINTKTNFEHIDLFEHFMAGVVASYFAYDFAIVFQGKSRHLSPALASMFALCFSVFLMVAWEFYEFTMDRLYGYTLQKSTIIGENGLVDTMVDLILGCSGSLIGMFFVAFSKNGLIGRHRKVVRAQVKEQSARDKAEEIAYQESHSDE
ncbi:MAG: hypothetical protein IJK40_01325 [Clostridia bacterium]|nr:hypothetical protein [Clostridia bacterium]